MKKILVIALCICSTTAFALTNQEKEKIVKDIYAQVFKVVKPNSLAPELVFNTSRVRNIAYMTVDANGKPQIGFESKAFDVCESFGERRDDAIAYLIGHEISHFYYEHHWGTEFRSAFNIAGLEKEMHGIDAVSAKKFETQADQKGGIFCYLAGYNPSGIAADLLKELYKVYQYEETPKYPTLEERIQIALEQDAIVEKFIRVFETANNAMILEQYDVAIPLYEYIINNKIESSEIYNNLGVAYFLRGVKAASPDDIKYIYPVELDLESKLKNKGQKGMGDDVRLEFEKALEYFKSAKAFDENYRTAYLNIACAYSVLGKYRDAIYHAETAMELAQGKHAALTSNARLVIALVHAINPNGDKKLAESTLSELSKAGNLLATANLKLFRGEEVLLTSSTLPISWMDSSVGATERPKFPKPEVVSGLSNYSLAALGSEIPTDAELEISINDDRNVIVGNLTDSRVYVTLSADGSKYLLLHATLDSYTGETASGLMRGASLEELVKLYGSPNAVLNTNRGLSLVYNQSKIIFLLGHDRKVENWVVFRYI